ncbi:hypothetical protein OG500_10655 [Kitasatospora sp. NBC_01250]|uniref:hypothetical protein n=1 Tax=Kitasatospora sp. NBC_01250 TaxID=2903571 RepID=UPI002E315536|nr:hypothetical protein [Kitasatospora sp. NBC_01250]
MGHRHIVCADLLVCPDMGALTNLHDERPHTGEDGTPITLAERCHATGGLFRTTLGELREELGYGRLGRHVLAEAAESLTLEGLGWFPSWRLSPRNDKPHKDQELWVFARDGGLRCQIICAIQEPDDCDVPAVLNGLLTGRPQDLSPEDKLDLIREILGL